MIDDIARLEAIKKIADAAYKESFPIHYEDGGLNGAGDKTYERFMNIATVAYDAALSVIQKDMVIVPRGFSEKLADVVHEACECGLPDPVDVKRWIDAAMLLVVE